MHNSVYKRKRSHKRKTIRKSKRKTIRKSKRKTIRKSKRKTTHKRRRMCGGGGDFQPAPGGAYFAGSAAPFPSGTYLPVSDVGIPAGGFDPAMPAGQQTGGIYRHKRSRSRGMRSRGRHSRGMRSRGRRSRGMRSRGRHMRGGGLSSFVSSILPDEIVNIGRSIPASVGHMVDKFNGTISSPSSLVYPTQQPHVYQGSPGASSMPPIDVMSAFNRANASVSPI